ncbi:MAG: hypothetical protein OCC49_06410 [Fibrobacterales bacterium]
MSNDRHESFLRKNNALSMAYEMDKKDKYLEDVKSGKIKKKTTCEKCGKEAPVKRYSLPSTDRLEGSASFSIKNEFLCEACAPIAVVKKDRQENKSPKEIKAMLRGLKKGRL